MAQAVDDTTSKRIFLLHLEGPNNGTEIYRLVRYNSGFLLPSCEILPPSNLLTSLVSSIS